MIRKLIVGTTQFGMNYSGKKKIKIKEINLIFKILKKNKINIFDTAPSYGDSEKKIGDYHSKKRVFSKIVLSNKHNTNKNSLISEVKKSLNLVKEKKFEGLLINNPNYLIKNKKKKQIIQNLKYLKKANLTKKIGISIYDVSEFSSIIKFWKPDIIQFPLNIFDQRFAKKKFLKKIKELKIQTIARSIFLKGLIFNKNTTNLFLKKKISNYDSWCNNNRITRLSGCLNFIKKYKQLDYFIVGIDNSFQLQEIISVLKKKSIYVPNKFKISKKNIIDPRLW